MLQSRVAFEWLSGRSKETHLEAAIRELGEPIVARDLCQVAPRDSTIPEWCLLLLTETALIILHSKSRNWASRLIGTGTEENSARRIPIESIESIQAPERGSWLSRLVRGPTVTVVVQLRDGSRPVEIIADDRSLDFYAEVKRRVAGEE